MRPLMRPRWRCGSCGHESDADEPWACRCGLTTAWFPVDGGPEEQAAVRADALPPSSAVGVPHLSWGPLFAGGLVPFGISALLYGRAGSGKSRAAMRLAAELAPMLYVALEMSPADVAVTLSDLAVPLDAVWLAESERWQVEAERIRARVVVVDSLAAVHRPVVHCRAARDWVSGRDCLVVLIAHANSRGRAKGDTGLSHWPSAVIEARSRSRGMVELSCPTKNRHGPTGPRRPRVAVSIAPGPDPQARRPVKGAESAGQS